MGSIIDISEVILEMGLSSSITDEERALIGSAITRAEGAVKRFLRYDPAQLERTEYYPQHNYSYSARAAVWEVEGNQAILKRVNQVATSELQVQHLPIRSITSLAIDYDGRSGTASGAFAASTLKTEGTDFWPNYDGEDSGGDKLCRDGIIRSAGSWPVSPGTVKIVYTAGYSAAELHGQDTIVDASPIMDAVIGEAVRRARKALVCKKQAGTGHLGGTIVSERMGDYSYRLDPTTANRVFGSLFDMMPESKEKIADFVNVGWCIAP